MEEKRRVQLNKTVFTCLLAKAINQILTVSFLKILIIVFFILMFNQASGKDSF